MVRQLYALLVGINNYNHPRITNLKGCVNDVKNMKKYLEGRFENPQIKTLFNNEATYYNIIDTFRSHLTANATKDDIVLFQYSGHGAREAAAREFKPFFPEGKEETLVCYDSRKNNGHDLADKELAVLIEEVAQTGAHVVVLLDCCHSGSGTREADDFRLGATRRTYHRALPRPIDTYIDGYYEKQLTETGKVVIPSSKHVLLAACDRTQSARETTIDTGVFTATLLNTLKKMGNDISYANLFLKCRVEIVNLSIDQTPQFDAVNRFNAHSKFLDGEDMADINKKEVFLEDGEWTMNYGAIDGIEITPDCVPVFEIFSKEDDSKRVGYAEAKDVFPGKTYIDLDFTPRSFSGFYAKPLSMPTAKHLVHLHGDSESIKRFKKQEMNFVSVEFTDSPEGTKYNVEVTPRGIYVYFNHTKKLIQGYENINFKNNVKYTADLLRHILRWENGLLLQNHNTELPQDKIDFILTDEDGNKILSNEEEGDNRLNEDFFTLYLDEDAPGGKLKVLVKAQHRFHQTLHFALVYFSEEFGIQVYRNEPVGENKSAITLWGEGPKDYLWLMEEDEYHDTFKLIASTEPITDMLLQQSNIDIGKTKRSPRRTGNNHNMSPLVNDWCTKTIHIRLVRRQKKVSKAPIELGTNNQLVIAGHPTFEAKLSVAAANTNSRNIDDLHPAAVVFSRQEGELLSFGAYHGHEGNVLVLNEIDADETLKQQPLEIGLNMPTTEDETILCFTFDREMILPIGTSSLAADGSTKITIDEIPNISYPDQKRSLKKALKLVFFKFIKLKNKLQQLRQVIYHEDGSAERSSEGVVEAVGNANRILLLIHGIIGDTKQMAEAFRPAIETKKYDLVLTFDYENLNTEIEKTADILYTKLTQDLNLHLVEGKQLDIVAHSMGGLVSRYMIEKLRGDTIVQHLFMCGTPNAGSPISKILDYRNMVIALMTVGINLGFSTPLAAGVLGILDRSKALTVTLEQMNPEGEFIASLKNTLQPRTQYTIIAGDLAAYREKSEEYVQGIFNKALKGVSNLFHNDELNDIAVSTASIKAVDHFHQPPPRKLEVACHHMNYFTQDGGFKAVREEVGC